MDLRIKKMVLQNFKGIKTLELFADGENLTVYGDNATGKTTIFDAFTWLLFGKDSLGRSDFGIKTQDENGNAIHNLEHSVECELAIDNSILTLKKVFSEKWTKKRGSADAEFSGHETKFFVNEVPSTKKEYESKIASIIDDSLFKTLTNPLYFNEQLKWQDRRAILLSLCEDITDLEIINGVNKFSPLAELLQGRTVQEYKKIVSGKQSAINERLKAIPQRIDEANRVFSSTVEEVDENEKAVIEKKLSDLNNEIVEIKSGAKSSDVEIELRELRERKLNIINSKSDISAMNQELFDAKINLQNTEREIDICRQKIVTVNTYIEYLSHQADALRKDWHEVNEKQYTDSGICPTCGQALPEEQIAEAKAKFNTKRAEKLESITEKGKEAKAKIQDMEALRIEEAEKIDNLLKEAEERKAVIKHLTESIEKVKSEFDKIKDKELAEVNTAIAEAEKKAQNETNSIEPKIYAIAEQISREMAKLDEINKAIAEREVVERQKQRIAELEAEEKSLAKEYSELEKVAFLIEEFIRHKIGILNDKINEHFKYAKFKLFDEQINGGIAECCETTFNGVEYSDLNNASKINIGLDIINTLCKINNKFVPVIVDNAESVTNILPTTSQMICLVVSAEDKALRVEKNI